MDMHTTSLTPSTRTEVSGPGAEALVDLGAIADNVRVLREHAGPAQVMAVVKADAYGHGAPQVARAAVAAGAAELGVATIDEALALRGGGITAPVLSWLHPPGTDFAPALTADVQIAVSSVRQVGDLLDAVERTGRTAEVTVKVDTGLNRNGVSPPTIPPSSPHCSAPRPPMRSGSGASCRIWPTATCPTILSTTFRPNGSPP